MFKYDSVGVSNTEATNESVDDSDEEHDDQDGVVEDLSLTFVVLLVDIEPAQNEEKNTNNNLKCLFSLVKIYTIAE